AHLLPNVCLGPAAASGVQGPRLISELPPRLLFSNSSGSSVACLASGEPAPSVRWLGDDGEEAPDVSRLRHTRPDGTLVFLPFRPDQFRRDVHEARYRCAAANAIGTVVSSQVHVTAGTRRCYPVQIGSDRCRIKDGETIDPPRSAGLEASGFAPTRRADGNRASPIPEDKLLAHAVPKAPSL
ncbi:unnamed protein product, partial [Ixodes persulcatus]